MAFDADILGAAEDDAEEEQAEWMKLLTARPKVKDHAAKDVVTTAPLPTTPVMEDEAIQEEEEEDDAKGVEIEQAAPQTPEGAEAEPAVEADPALEAELAAEAAALVEVEDVDDAEDAEDAEVGGDADEPQKVADDGDEEAAEEIDDEDAQAASEDAIEEMVDEAVAETAATPRLGHWAALLSAPVSEDLAPDDPADGDAMLAVADAPAPGTGPGARTAWGESSAKRPKAKAAPPAAVRAAVLAALAAEGLSTPAAPARPAPGATAPSVSGAALPAPATPPSSPEDVDVGDPGDDWFAEAEDEAKKAAEVPAPEVELSDDEPEAGIGGDPTDEPAQRVIKIAAKGVKRKAPAIAWGVETDEIVNFEVEDEAGVDEAAALEAEVEAEAAELAAAAEVLEEEAEADGEAEAEESDGDLEVIG